LLAIHARRHFGTQRNLVDVGGGDLGLEHQIIGARPDLHDRLGISDHASDGMHRELVHDARLRRAPLDALEVRAVSGSDDRAAFAQQVRAKSEALGRNRQVFDAAVDTLHAADRYDYFYLWMGVPIIQLPADVMATQEDIWATCPMSSSRPAWPATARCYSWSRCSS
jgi:hypothetical protein